MPWLVREDEAPDAEPLLLVHVPRCGGTSLVKQFDVEGKSRRRTRNPAKRLGLLYFFYRYRLLETSNFPLLSFENLYALFIITTAFVLYFVDDSWRIAACADSRWCPAPLSVSFWTMGLVTFLMSTFVMNATIMARCEPVRKAMLVLFGKMMCDFAATPVYLHGVSWKGWLMHFTAEKMLRHKLALRKDLAQHAFAIVRDPYSRLVSVFRYNQRGGCESFKHFLREWQRKLRVYEASGTTDDWDVYCHVLPMHAFTHAHAAQQRPQQIVGHIVRQEDIKVLKRKHAADAELFQARYAALPDKVLRALREMPHSNKRAAPTEPWQSLYDQEAMDLVLDMYAADFALFGYDTRMEKRADLMPKRTLEELQRDACVGGALREKRAASAESRFSEASSSASGDGDSNSSAGTPSSTATSPVVKSPPESESPPPPAEDEAQLSQTIISVV